MQNPLNSTRFWKSCVLILLLITLFVVFSASPAKADVAPPASPPGTNIIPGEEATQVRMVAETVTLTVMDARRAQARAVFTMRNLGDAEERMDVRFPLTFWDGSSDGFFNCPEIEDFQVSVDGQATETRRIATTPENECDLPMPWSVFEVVFPPEEDVTIEVTYTATGYGYDPYIVYWYILQTGAGWKGTIGSADITIRLPYEVNDQNIVLEGHVGYGGTTPGASLSGNEVRWHFEDFEPAAEHDIHLLMVIPGAWNEILARRQAVDQNPEDGEAWGRLGLGIKELIRIKNWLRDDQGGVALYTLSAQAYEQAVTHLPEDAAWHFGYAELLWLRFTTYGRFAPHAAVVLTQALEELHTSLALDPEYQRALDLAEEISFFLPELIQASEAGYQFLGLTATPAFPSPTPTPTATPETTNTPEPSATPAPSATSTPTPAPTTTPAPSATPQGPPQGQEESPPPSSSAPCGGALALPLLTGTVWAISRRLRGETH